MPILKIGEKFGLITVIGEPEKRRNGTYYLCMCDCGETLNIAYTAIWKKSENNGGCQKCAKGRIGKHKYGRSTDPTYSKYQAMKQRCLNPNHVAYANYGGRGITLCERWYEFVHFLADMGECPGDGYSIDRIDSNGNYEPENCKWSTVLEQARNQRSNIKVSVDGIEFGTIAEAAGAYGLPEQTVYARIAVYGWSADRALKEPVDIKKRHKKKITF
ncbi:hypothetical protein [Klebsiella pneumoniae]|mgnify:CR=1 FL=1|uniref:hypothetical protein n=1 Tax=Klebsiella pneumoniae TaxID=573 RepID=UPI001330C1D1|nr:hypothetical protein [Klebsiella pneumoniae]